MNSKSAKSSIFLTSGLLTDVPGLVHGFFTRHGGVSEPPCESLSVSWSNGDSPRAVSENLSRIAGTLGLERLISGKQVHGDVLHVIDEAQLEKLESRPPLVIAPAGDALATQLRGLGLLIKIADCQSVFLVDPQRRVAANIHSGWRGSVQNIVGKTVESLRARFGCEPAQMLAAVGPSLGPCCAEFVNYRSEIPQELWRFQVRPNYFDFWEITRFQLAAAGIPGQNIDILARCTVCGTSDFFSYRGERVTGRMGAVIGWR